MSNEDKPRRGDRVRVTFEAEFVNGDDSRHAVVDIADGMGPVHIGIPAWSTVEVLDRADDPSADLTGSIRRTKAVTCVARERDGGAGFYRWIAVEINEAFTDDHMRGSHVIGAVPGTPAAEVTVTGEDIDRWAEQDAEVPAGEVERAQQQRRFRYFTRKNYLVHRITPQGLVQYRHPELGWKATEPTVSAASLEAGWNEVDVEPIGGVS